MSSELPIAELRVKVRRLDVLLRKALGASIVADRQLEDLRTQVAVLRIQLRRREAAEALRGLQDAS